MKFKSEVQLETLNNATVDTDKFLVSDSTTVKYRTGAQLLSDLGVSGLFVPYTGATGNVDLGTHTLLAKDLIINHSSGSGVAASITKNGSGEALTVIKGSGSGNAMSVTGGLTSLVNLSLSTVANATGDFLTHSGSIIHKRTPAQVLSDIGGQPILTNPITGTGTTNYVSKFTGSTSLGNSQIFDNGSGVGIGTATPNYTTSGRGVLDVNGGSQSMLALSVGGVGKSFLFYTGTDLLVSNESNGAIKFNTNGSEKAIITSNGNVGIGTTSPSYKLDLLSSNPRLRVKDSSTGYSLLDLENGGGSFYVGNDNSTGGSFGGSAYAGTLYRSGAYPISMWTNGLERMRITSSGNVGIGTTSPAKLLDVNGDALINGLTIGRGSGNGIQNVAVGGVALYSNTTGAGNTAIGYYTLSLNTSGGANVAIGNASLSVITSGSENTAIGTGSLGNLEAGNYNTCIGTRVGESTTNASGMTLIGCNLKYKPNNVSLLGDNELAIAQQASGANGLVHFYAPDTVSVAATAADNVLIVDPLAYSAVFLDYMIDDLYDNLRAGTIKAIFRNNLLGIEWDESATASIGSTLDYIFNVQDNGSGLLAITLTNNNPDNPVFCRLTSRILLRVT